jgi:hypothetical protein
LPVRPLALAVWAIVALATDARAELVFFTTGRALSVERHVVQGDTIVFDLRGGGQMSCARALVLRIEPDEVPLHEAATMLRPEAPVPSPDSMLAARPFADLIAAAAAAHGVDLRLVHAVVEVESNYQPRARSRKGARGLMQLMPATVRQYAVRNAFDPKSNLDAGVRHLKSLLNHFDLALALAAYNAGEAVVRAHGGVPPYRETRDYVRRVLARVGAPTPVGGF